MRLVLLYGVFASLAAGTSHGAPSQEQYMRALNDSLGGRVHANEPFAKPCFSIYEGKHVGRDDGLCAERRANYSSPTYRNQFPGAYMYEQSSICASDKTSADKCLLDTKNPSNGQATDNIDCKQGNIPSYYVEVREANDAVQAFKYARLSGSKLAIKNSGHSFMEDNSQKGALLLWTRNLRSLDHDENFVPEGCSSDETFNAITTGAGVNCGEAYEFADKKGVTILCGYSPTVGLSGGWVQNGGHSVLSNVYGLGADRVLQFTVATPDGKVRVANKCQNRNLFWALRGGGGGTFGVVIDSTHLVEPAMALGVASVGVPAKDKEAVKGFMELLVDTAVDMAEDGWGGHIYGNYFVHVTPKMTTQEAATKSLAKIVSYVEKHGGTANITVLPTWYSFFDKYVLSGAFAVGGLSILNTRLVPTDVFTKADLSDKYKSHLRDFVQGGGLPYIPVVSPYVYNGSREATSVQPAWYTSLWEYGNPAYWQWNSTFEERVEVVKGMQKQTETIKELTPGGGTYRNEANPFIVDWQQEYFGHHYEELLKIKKRYDPKGLLKCWHCVGWTDEDVDGSCYKEFKNIGI